MFERHKYYSQTEAVKKFKVSIEQFKELTKDMPVERRYVDLGGFSVRTYYVPCELVDKLNLPLRTQI